MKKTVVQMLTCDVCGKLISDLSLGMVFIDAAIGKRVQTLRVAHKLSCDPQPAAKCYELLWFEKRKDGLEHVLEIADAFGLDAPQLERLVEVAHAVPLALAAKKTP